MMTTSRFEQEMTDIKGALMETLRRSEELSAEQRATPIGRATKEQLRDWSRRTRAINAENTANRVAIRMAAAAIRGCS